MAIAGFDQAPPSLFAYSSSIASSYRRSASISASVFSRVVPAPVFTPAPVAVELESPVCVCVCSDMDESEFGSEDDGASEVMKGILKVDVMRWEIDLMVGCC